MIFALKILIAFRTYKHIVKVFSADSGVFSAAPGVISIRSGIHMQMYAHLGFVFVCFVGIFGAFNPPARRSF